ncbi:AraC family transcriptional regulator [Mesorhizobium sp. L-8-10]|uniref:helix-turn-helix domain-containing protein n=1 Tax=Mesorhizobium sp. L-8-10 TaxID=2744523 RepID=UPI0019285F6D|nr:helix-turn-helix transcriptional regulator [Mesorhizobium sp. L-8-10]BCH35176.1 AraC family transcriptional regulator [Mesorhizobium sp. L-8-10]
MPVTIPLIRGFALFPTLGWVASKGIPIEDALKQAGLPADLAADPFRPIPLIQAAALLRTAARRFGPDLPCRVLAQTSNLELALIGKVALGTGTPRDAIDRIRAALPFYSSHEVLSTERRQGATIVREQLARRFDGETAHLLFQYAAAIIDRICGMTGAAPHRFTRIEMPAHPTAGLAHLVPWFGDGINAAKVRGLTIWIDDRIMDRRFTGIARDRVEGRRLTATHPLRGDGTLSSAVATLLASMVDCDEAPSISRLVAAAGTSERSFQRQLRAEGTSFSELLSEVRRTETLKRLSERGNTIAAIAAELGYSDQASFTRAFRRWTGSSPGQFRARTS